MRKWHFNNLWVRDGKGHRYRSTTLTVSTLPICAGRGARHSNADPRNFINDSCEATNTYKLIARILTSLSHTLYVKPHVHTACSHEILFTTHTNLILTFNEKSNRCIQPRVYTLDTTEEVKLYENNNFSAVCQVLEII